MLAYLHMLGVSAFLGREADAMALVGSRLGGAWRAVIVLTVLVSDVGVAVDDDPLSHAQPLSAWAATPLIPRRFGTLARDGSPRFALLVITAVATVVTVLSGASPTVSAALTFALKGSGIFLGLLFTATAASAFKLIGAEGEILRGRILPAAGIAGILSAIIVQIADPANGRLAAFGGRGARARLAVRVLARLAHRKPARLRAAVEVHRARCLNNADAFYSGGDSFAGFRC